MTHSWPSLYRSKLSSHHWSSAPLARSTHLLIDDVKLLKPKVGELKPNVTDEEEANRRFYIRAVFALVEAFVEQHRRLLLELCECSKIELREKTRRKLQEIKEIFREDGTAELRRAAEKQKEKIDWSECAGRGHFR